MRTEAEVERELAKSRIALERWRKDLPKEDLLGQEGYIEALEWVMGTSDD